VAEHTGVYGDLLLYLSNQVGVSISFMSGYTIKHSLGLIKGKSDPVDARRIREYGERFFDKLVCTVYEGETMKELRELYVLRAQLVKAEEPWQPARPAESINRFKVSVSTARLSRQKKRLALRCAEVEREMLALIQSNEPCATTMFGHLH
jgi:hypothetical protein